MADKTLPPIAIGDSLAVGMREANNLPGLARVGAGPKEVFEKLQQFATENSLAGRDVFLGTGMPNIPEQKKYVEQQIDFVRKQGGNPILIGVGPGTKSKPTTGQNEFLAGLAERKGLTYMGPLVNMFPDVTKDPMGLHLRPKQYQQIFKQYSQPQSGKNDQSKLIVPMPYSPKAGEDKTPTRVPMPYSPKEGGDKEIRNSIQPMPFSGSSADLLSQFTGAVMQAESLGKRYDKSGKLLTSSKGAQGEMQVMPGTVTDPGFGVRPAKNNSPDEIARVGRDYAAVMLRRYNNDPTAAAVAYNWGPGNADKWVKRGADFESLPKETQNYVTRITGRMGVPIAAKRVPSPPKRVEKEPSPRAAVGEDYAPLSTLEPAPRTAQQGPAQPQPEQMTRADMERLGPGYQAAFAAMTLGDSREDDDEYDDEETIAERYLERRGEQMAQEESTLEEDTPQSSPLASLSEISYQSPFAQEEPVMMAHGGVVHRADGSPMYGEGVDLSDSGGMTADTIKNLFSGPKPTAREALSILGQIGAGGVSNIESTLRGSVAAIPGFVGDVESGFRDDKSRRFMTTEEVKRDVLPSRLTAPNKYTEGYEELGTYLPLPVNLQKVLPPSAVKGLIAKARGMLPAKEVDTFPMGKLSAQEVLQQLKSFDPKKLEKAREAFLAPSAEKRRMYHGTFQQPLSLELTKAGEVNRILGMSDQGFTSFRPGTGGMTFVSPQTEFADMFAGMRLGSASKFTGPSRVYPVHVQVKKPFDFENTSHLKEIAAEVYKSANKAKKDKKLSVHTTSWMNSPEDIGFALSRGSWAEIENPLVINAAKKLGFDGMYMLEAGVKNLGIFDPKKIKSAIGNEGSFNVKTPDIRKAEGGVVHRAEGSPVYGEDADLSNSGVVTADTIKNLFSGPKPTPREMLGMFKDLGKASLSNLESVGRRSVAGLPGTVGSIESIFRDDKDRRFATGEEIERQYLPKRLTTPTKDAAGYGEIGEFIDPTIALKLVKPTARATLAAMKASGPQIESALMKMAPAAQPMYAVKPKGGVFFPTEFGSNIDNYLEDVADKVLRYNPNILGKDAGRIRNLIIDKGRKYITSTYGTGSDPVREAILEGRLTDVALGSRGSEKSLSSKLVHNAREGSPEALKKFEELYDDATNLHGAIVFPTNVKDFNTTFKVAQLEKEKMLKEGVPKELQNTSFLEKSLDDLKVPYASEANRALAAYIEGKAASVPAEVRSLLTAVRGKPFFGKGPEPIYDMFAYGPKMDILSPNIAGRGIATLDIKDIEKMSFPEMIIRGSKNTLFERSQDAVIRTIENNKSVPNKFFTEGVTSVPRLKNKGWVSIDTPFAARVEGAAMRHSVGGYGIPGEYGVGGSEALLSGKVKLYSLRPEVNKPVVTVEARMTPDGPYIFDVRSKFNSVPTEEETKKIFELFDAIQPKTFGVKTYYSTREGKTITGDNPVRDWGEMYSNYLKYRNKGAE